MSSDTVSRPGIRRPTLLELGDEYDLTLAAQNKSGETRRNYRTAVRQMHDFLTSRGMPTQVDAIAREHVEAYIAHLFEPGRAAMTAKTRYGGLKTFFAWCVDEGEITRSPMERMKPPQVPDQTVDVLTEDQLRSLLDVCKGGTSPSCGTRRSSACSWTAGCGWVAWLASASTISTLRPARST